MKLIYILLFLLPINAFGQDGPKDFENTLSTLHEQLKQSVKELSDLRKEIVEEKVPLSRKLSKLEADLVEVKAEYQKTVRLLDSRNMDLNNLGSEIKMRKDESSYLSNLLNDYIRNFESRLHIAEVHRYGEVLEEAKLAPENSNLSDQEVFQAQAKLLNLSLERLEEALGGVHFKGTAVNSNGLVKKGSFVLLGPAALFQSDDGKEVGTAEQRLGSLEPTIIEFAKPDDAAAAAEVASSNVGHFPLDPTLGNAHKIESTQESFFEHVQKGGSVMVPIFALAGAAFLVALYKWISLMLVPKPSAKRVEQLLTAVRNQDKEDVKNKAAQIKGPIGKMLSAGIKHIKAPRELIEEVMYETVLTTRFKLNRFLPFVAIAAASAPLLGLLGTVTGIISTFKLITVYGSGDVTTLSGGISEALITTEFGLIVAIPSLLMHAFLSRKARGVIGKMETAAVSLANEISLTQLKPENRPNGNGGENQARENQAKATIVVKPPVSPDLSSRMAGGNVPKNIAGGIPKNDK